MTLITGRECEDYFLQGIISNLDKIASIADVTVDGDLTENVDIHYHCDAAGTEHSAAVFSNSDNVVVRMRNGQPQEIIGFWDEPKPCGEILVELDDGTKEVWSIDGRYASSWGQLVGDGNTCQNHRFGNLIAGDVECTSAYCCDEPLTIGYNAENCTEADTTQLCEATPDGWPITWYKCGVKVNNHTYRNSQTYNYSRDCGGGRYIEGVNGAKILNAFSFQVDQDLAGTREYYWGFLWPCSAGSCVLNQECCSEHGLESYGSIACDDPSCSDCATGSCGNGESIFSWGIGDISHVRDFDITSHFINMSRPGVCSGCAAPNYATSLDFFDWWREIDDSLYYPALINLTSINKFIWLSYYTERHFDYEDISTFNCINHICECTETQTCNYNKVRHWTWTDKVVLCIDGDCTFFADTYAETTIEDEQYEPAISDYKILIHEYEEDTSIFFSVFKAGGAYYCHSGIAAEGEIDIVRDTDFEDYYDGKNIIKVFIK